MMATQQPPPRDLLIPSADGTRLRGWHWTRPDPRGVLVIAHGFGEHGGCYRHVAEALAPALEIDVVATDLRGHGRSPGRRGVVRRYADLLADVRSSLEWAARERPGLPLYLLGHSNGGLLTLRLALDQALAETKGGPAGSVAPSGLIVSNPSLQIRAPIRRTQLAAGRFLLYFAPGVTLSGKLDAALMTSDLEMQRERDTDPLRHSRISAPYFFGMAGTGTSVARDAGALTLPVLMLLGDADPVIDCETSRRVFERFASTDKTLKVYAGMRHEPFNELGREQVFADIEAWLRPRL
jgi:alpha-beta hydrolase superfamily lysophospholipase